MKSFKITIFLTVWVFCLFGSRHLACDELEKRFTDPPLDTRPWCYWYWISDNISKDGITRDLEAMARVGIGEALIGNIVDPDTPHGDVPLFSDDWFECMTHAVTEGERLCQYQCF